MLSLPVVNCQRLRNLRNLHYLYHENLHQRCPSSRRKPQVRTLLILQFWDRRQKYLSLPINAMSPNGGSSHCSLNVSGRQLHSQSYPLCRPLRVAFAAQTWAVSLNPSRRNAEASLAGPCRNTVLSCTRGINRASRLLQFSSRRFE